MIIDKLFNRVFERGPVCVGLDTDAGYVPVNIVSKHDDITKAIYEYNCALIDSTIDVCSVFKVQIAYYEALGIKGLELYRDTLRYLRSKDAIIIADVKRGDIAKTAEMYAKAHFSGDFEADFMTISPYMGVDTLEPYLPFLKDQEKGLFVLVRTSNPGAGDFEYLSTNDNKKVYEVVGSRIETFSSEHNLIGSCGFSSVGAVMGCTHADEAEKMRNDLSRTFFLIPGYGAQGGSALDVIKYMKNSNGGVVNSSRAILLAHKKADPLVSFDEAARNEVIRMRKEIEEARYINDLR